MNPANAMKYTAMLFSVLSVLWGAFHLYVTSKASQMRPATMAAKATIMTDGAEELKAAATAKNLTVSEYLSGRDQSNGADGRGVLCVHRSRKAVMRDPGRKTRENTMNAASIAMIACICSCVFESMNRGDGVSKKSIHAEFAILIVASL